jgi:hypothetical protein
MRTLTLTLILAIASAPVLPAQVRVAAKLGGTWSSTLAEDEIGTPISVKTGIGPTLGLSASIPTGRKYRLGMETIFSTSSVEAEDEFNTTDLGSIRTATLLLSAGGPAMVANLHWQVGVGLIKYFPGEDEGLFRQGGPARLTGTFLAEYRRPLRPGWEWTVGVRYGFHQFITQELESRGFSRPQSVHRVGLEAGVARYFQ